MYDITDIRGMMGLSKDQLDKMKDDLAQQRWEDYANGMPEYKPSFPTKPYKCRRPTEDRPDHQ